MDALVSSLRRGDWKEKSWSQLRAGKEEGEPGMEGRELKSRVSEEVGLASHCGAGLLGLEEKKLCRITDHAQRHPDQSRGSWDRCNIYHTGSFP